jgi:prepilin-type N-terminal cleavage/methylation domain-containing protein
MNRYSKKISSGFTLIELVVVIAIITILATIILASISEARQNTREKRRISDLAQIEFALTLYKEKNYRTAGTPHGYPAATTWVKAGSGGVIDTVTQEFMGATYTDPINTGVYGYWYHSNFNCSAPGQQVIVAYTMEQSKNANFSSVCTNNTGNTALLNGYVVVLK